jgi:CopG antitoxin of type II toxin-antitoxin system
MFEWDGWGATMRRKDLIPLTSIDQVPKDMTEDEAHELWSTHEITEEYLASAPPVPEEDLPPIRPPRKWVSLHLRRETFEKVRKLARQRGAPVSDLIDSLATQALTADEEERLRATGS